MNLSKRSLILTAVALLCVIAAVFSVYMEKRETEKEINDLLNEEPEVNEEPEEEPKPTRTTKKTVKAEPEPVKETVYEAGAVKD